MDAEQVLAFRAGRSGLIGDRAANLAEAAGSPASDFSRDSALMALGARYPDLSRDEYEEAVDAGEEIAVAHIIRGAIHALRTVDLGLFGRALISTDDDELATQLGQQFKRWAVEHDFAPIDALEQVAEATREALSDRALDKNGLHEELRGRVDAELMPWCRGCESYHVAPKLWRYATVSAGARLDSERRYALAEFGPQSSPGDAVRRFLRLYGPSTPACFAEWAGLAKSHGKRLWEEASGEMAEAVLEGRKMWLIRDDISALESPPQAEGTRMIPPGDPYLQRARATVERRLPERSQQVTLRALGDDGVRRVVDAYLQAWDREDVDGVVAMLTDDASFSMPPLRVWYGGAGGPEEMAAFMRVGPLSGEWDWRHILTTANGQPALGFYCWYEPDGAHRPFALNVLELRGERISDVTCFATRAIEATDRERYGRWPEEPLDERRARDFFYRFGLPERLE